VTVSAALEKALAGGDLTAAEALPLATATGPDLRALAAAADELRRQQVGPVVTYVINRNINFTNVCIKHCGFCAFSRDHREEQGYFLPTEEILRRIEEAVRLGATEVCIQAGLPPKLEGSFYQELTRTVKRHFPALHLHAFSPEEVLYGSIRARVSVREYLAGLKEAGLDTLPGTSAEILDAEVRERLAAGRISVEQWVEVISTAHELGLRTTSTMMFGHLEQPRHWVAHLLLLRDLQARTGGFTEFVPLSFVHQEAPMYRRQLQPDVRAGATGAEVVRVHALARILLGKTFRNIQASWVKEGPRLAQLLLDAGCNDLGGTLMNESISTSAGASFGQLLPPSELRRLIVDAGREPAQRNTLYQLIEGGGDGLDARPDFGSYRELVMSDQHRYQHPSRAHLPVSNQ